MWGGRKRVRWEKVTCTREIGGLGVQDFMVINESTAIKDPFSLWENGGSIYNCVILENVH